MVGKHTKRSSRCRKSNKPYVKQNDVIETTFNEHDKLWDSNDFDIVSGLIYGKLIQKKRSHHSRFHIVSSAYESADSSKSNQRQTSKNRITKSKSSRKEKSSIDKGHVSTPPLSPLNTVRFLFYVMTSSGSRRWMLIGLPLFHSPTRPQQPSIRREKYPRLHRFILPIDRSDGKGEWLALPAGRKRNVRHNIGVFLILHMSDIRWI